MVSSASVYATCHRLFTRYPLAARHVSPSVHSMVLMIRNGDDVGFSVLARRRKGAVIDYSLSPWPSGDPVPVKADGPPFPDEAVHVLTDGIALPRHGSIFGWLGPNIVTAMVVCYTDSLPERPLPRWSVMPLAGTAEELWPPFTAEPFFGQWFWEHCKAGDLVLLDPLIAETEGAVFWVSTHASLGSDCCAIADDIAGPRGRILRRGRYVYSDLLQQGTPIPSLAAMLADSSKIDLAPRFPRFVRKPAAPNQRQSAPVYQRH